MPEHTVLMPEKTRKQVSGTFYDFEGFLHHYQEKEYNGYEIHMGENAGDTKFGRGYAECPK